jgi:hypothetical protein
MGPEGRRPSRPGGSGAAGGGSLEERAYDAVLAWLVRGVAMA